MILKKNLIVALLITFFACGNCSNALSKTHSGVIIMEVDLSTRAQGQTARLWIPYPVSDRDQLISLKGNILAWILEDGKVCDKYGKEINRGN